MTNNDPEYGRCTIPGARVSKTSQLEKLGTQARPLISLASSTSQLISSVEKGKISNMFKEARKKRKKHFQKMSSAPQSQLCLNLLLCPKTWLPSPERSRKQVDKSQNLKAVYGTQNSL